MQRLANLGVHIPDILLPAEGVDMARWAVVACDQYTSQPDYWDRVTRYVDGEPSTLNLMLPEVYLESADVADRTNHIQTAMKDYLQKGILTSAGHGLIYVQRDLRGRTRQGLVMAIDLEYYDYTASSRSLIRATEETVEDRLPPRVRIRKDSVLELPHIMLLVDDPRQIVLQPLQQRISSLPQLYDFELMEQGGRVQGWLVKEPAMLEMIADALELLAVGKDPLLFAVGDGNHSLATAKKCWENSKISLTLEEQANHPARFALVELVNLHDTALVFEPIHRVVFGVDAKKMLSDLVDEIHMAGHTAFLGEGEGHCIPYVYSEGSGCLTISKSNALLPLGVLQPALDKCIKRHGARIDYIHGDEIALQLGSQPDHLGLLLPPLDKSALFSAVKQGGPLQRKSFSMGEAHEKRYYLECRRIQP